MHVENHHSMDELSVLIRAERDARRLRKLQVIVQARQGRTAPQIASTLQLSRRNLQEWVRRYNTQGLDGLTDRRRGGNQRKLTLDQEQQLVDYLDREANDPHGGIRRGEDLRVWIEQQFGKLYSLNGVYELLHRLGYSWLMPRPRHKLADPQAQAEFKKKRWKKSKISPANTRTNASKSGSRTKPALDSKAR